MAPVGQKSMLPCSRSQPPAEGMMAAVAYPCVPKTHLGVNEGLPQGSCGTALGVSTYLA